METFDYSFIDLFISGVLAAIMFGIGLSLTTSSFTNIYRYPKSFIIGLSAQMIGLPLIAFALVYFTDLPDFMKIGFIILSACPGGTTSGFITFLFKGNVALSISLTSINSFLTIASIPVIVNIALKFFLGKETEIELPVWHAVAQIFLVTILPAFLGIMVRTYKEKIALAIQKPLKGILLLLLGIVYTIKFFAGQYHGGTGITMSEILLILPYAFIFNVVCALFGLAVGKLGRLALRDSFTIAVEVTLHNTTLAFLVAGTLLQNQDMVKPALLYSLFSFWSSIVFGLVLKKANKMKLFGDFTK